MPKPDPLRSHFYQISKGPVAELREPGPRRPLWNLATAEQNVIGDHACSLRARITVQRCDYEDEGHFHVMSTERQLNVLRQRPFIGTLFTVAQKWHIFVRLITLSNIDQFSNFFHCQNHERICNSTITKDTTAPKCVAALFSEISVS